MPWAQFDDHFHDSHGALVAGVEACGLHLWATTWAAAHLSDGELPEPIVRRLVGASENGAELMVRLIDAGLWDRLPDGCVRLTDFLTTNGNRSREQVEADRKKRAEAGRKGGQNSGRRSRRRSKTEPEPEPEPEYVDPIPF